MFAPLPPAHSARTGVCQPALTRGRQGRNRAPMASRSFRRTRSTRGPSRRRAQSSGGSLLRFLLGVALFAWFLRSFILQPFYIPSASMLPSLYIGDYLFVAKWPYGYSRFSFPLDVPSFEGRLLGGLPKRGDVIVFR